MGVPDVNEYLKISAEVFTFNEDDDGTKHRISRLYPLEHLDQAFHALMTYEVLEILDDMRKGIGKRR